MFRKKKRSRNKGRSWVSLYEFNPITNNYNCTSKKGKKKKIFSYTKEEIEEICASIKETKGVKIFSFH